MLFWQEGEDAGYEDISSEDDFTGEETDVLPVSYCIAELCRLHALSTHTWLSGSSILLVGDLRLVSEPPVDIWPLLIKNLKQYYKTLMFES